MDGVLEFVVNLGSNNDIYWGRGKSRCWMSYSEWIASCDSWMSRWTHLCRWKFCIQLSEPNNFIFHMNAKFILAWFCYSRKANTIQSERNYILFCSEYTKSHSPFQSILSATIILLSYWRFWLSSVAIEFGSILLKLHRAREWPGDLVSFFLFFSFKQCKGLFGLWKESSREGLTISKRDKLRSDVP
jgi:hypothetical protein